MTGHAAQFPTRSHIHMEYLESAHELDGPKSPEEIKLFEARVDLAEIIREYIELQGWSQKEASQALGVSQPRVSNLMRGHISKFSLGTLIEMLKVLGFQFEFKSKITPKHAHVSMKLDKNLHVA